MRFGHLGTSIALAFAYMAIRLIMPWIRIGFLNPYLAAFLFVALLMLVQLALAVSVAGMQARPRYIALLALLSAVIVVGITVLLLKVKLSSIVLISMSLAFRDLFLMLFAASLGYTVSFIVREPSILLPVAVVAAMVDCWSVTVGPLRHVLENKPGVVAVASVQMPTPVPGVPGTMIGMGDFLFLALFFGILYRFSMNTRGAFWAGYALLTLSMLIVMKFSTALPALVPMALAITGTNIRHFKLKREEVFSTLYVGGFVLVLLVASGIYLSRR